MPESTARAERVELAAPAGASYIWQVPQKPVAVKLPLALIDRLEQETVEAFRSLTSRGSEIGGLLLGEIAPGAPAMVSVQDFELVACDYSRGPLYRLSDADMSRLERAIEQHTSGGGLRLAGFFRSHTRKGLSLDAEDVAFFEPRFHEPNHIVLLVRPFATKASVGGIFIRENGRLSGEASLLEFPFRSAELSGGSHRLSMEAAPASAAPAQPAPESQAAVKAPLRAQIVPIAPRREIAPQEVESRPAPPSPAQAAPMEARAAAPPPPAARVSPAPPASTPKAPPAPTVQTTARVTATPAAPAARIAPAAPSSKAAPAEPSRKSSEEKAVEKAPPATEVAAPAGEAAAPAFAAIPPAPRKDKKVRLMVAAALCMLALVVGALFVYPAMLHRGSRGQTAAQQDSSPLGLHIERTSGGMLLTWNRDSVVIQHASSVVLAISDGDRHENIAMDPNQVRTGSFVYDPISKDVSFQMEVTDANQARTTSESLRVHDPRPSPLDATSTPGSQPAQPSAVTPDTVKPADNAAADSASDSTDKPQGDAPVHTAPVKQFNPESLAQRLRPAAPADLAAAPAEVQVSPGAPTGLGSIVSGVVATPAAPSAPARSTDNAASRGSAPVSTGGSIVEPQPIYQKAPEYPRVAQQVGASGVVEIEATIGTDGQVKNAKAVNGNPMLRQAALDAVRQWKYKPALLNGKPVEAPVQVRLNFTPQR